MTRRRGEIPGHLPRMKYAGGGLIERLGRDRIARLRVEGEPLLCGVGRCRDRLLNPQDNAGVCGPGAGWITAAGTCGTGARMIWRQRGQGPTTPAELVGTPSLAPHEGHPKINGISCTAGTYRTLLAQTRSVNPQQFDLGQMVRAGRATQPACRNKAIMTP